MATAINYAPANLAGKKLKIRKLKDTGGLIVAQKHILARRENSTGTFMQYVPGHGGDAIMDLKTGLVGTVVDRLAVNGMVWVNVPGNTKRINSDGYTCPEEYPQKVQFLKKL